MTEKEKLGSAGDLLEQATALMKAVEKLLGDTALEGKPGNVTMLWNDANSIHTLLKGLEVRVRMAAMTKADPKVNN
jgi:hypothetical protein